jgi:hypothetical protein
MGASNCFGGCVGRCGLDREIWGTRIDDTAKIISEFKNGRCTNICCFPRR